MQITKPPHNRYALSCLDNGTYVKYVTVYSRHGEQKIWGMYSFLGSVGLWKVAK